MKRVGIYLAWILVLLAIAIAGWQVLSVPPPAENGVAGSGPKAAEFQRVFDQWKSLVAELWILQITFRKGDESQRAEIKEQWKRLMEEGDALEVRLLRAAEEAFVEAPNTDQQITELLVDVLVWHVEFPTDKYEEALRLGKLLIDHDCHDKRIYSPAGIGAFGSGDFDAAETYFKLAEEKVVNSDAGKQRLEEIPYYQREWPLEREIRAAEAKADDLPRVLLKTSQGDVTIELFENEAPNTVANFISLVNKGYYDGLTFHRVLSGQMAQGGCPNGDGTGGPGYHIPCECYQSNRRLHFRGSLSMAHSGRDTGGSQFFLTFLPTRHLDGFHTVFGRVVRGLDVLSKLQRRDPGKGPENLPQPDKIIEAKVLRDRGHPYVPKTLPLEKEPEKEKPEEENPEPQSEDPKREVTAE